MCSQTLFACRDFPVPMTSPRAAERRSRAELHGFPIASHHMACHGSVWHSRVLHFSAQFLLMPQRIATKETLRDLAPKSRILCTSSYVVTWARGRTEDIAA